MAQQLNPYITFDGNCAEAMDFYAAALGGSVSMMTFRDSGIDSDGIMHASVDTPAGLHVFASDTAEGMGPYQPGNNVQISISGDEDSTLRGYWDALSDSAHVVVPLERQMWGDVYGQLVDKYGIAWHINIAGGEA